MPRSLLPALLLVAACDESGDFAYQDPATVDSATDSGDAGLPDGDSGTDPGDTGTDPGADTGEAATSFEHCGEWLVPAKLPGIVTVGEARFDIQGFGQALTWEGCHVIRQFDAKGRFRCETSWTVTAEGSTQRQSPFLVFDATLVADPEHTSCPGAAKDGETRFGVDLPRDFRDPKVTLSTPDGDAWVERGSFPVDISQAGVVLTYGFEVGAE
ncbi:MAG: hypothetical protein H6732_04275 [Alphaproteobacteria bacterium]|nr:hypothetical protein [Alphaproteobacteria bacterium]